MKKLTGLLCALALLCGFCLTVFADNNDNTVKITTTVPSTHTITVAQADSAAVFCNGQPGTAFTVERLSQPQLLVRPDSGRVLTRVLVNGADVTGSVHGGYYTLPAQIYADGSCYHSNCYYLANGSDSTVTGITAKTAEQFASGEVAYLLQGTRTDTTTVWGQTLTGANKQNYPVLRGEKVYRSTPCPTDYSNGESKSKLHNIGTDGYCTVCKELCIAYTVTIPATVELGNAANATATISAENVTLPTDKTLKVTVNGPFTATLVGTTDVTAHYTIKNGSTALESGDPVLTAKNGESPKIPLTFVKPDAAPYAGSYIGTVTFEVSVGTPTT